MQNYKTDQSVVLFVILGILSLSLFLQHEFNLRQSLLFIIGISLGIALMHAMFGFSGAWRSFIRDRNSLGIRAQLWLLVLSSILFFPFVAGVFPSVQVSAAMGQIGLSVFVGAFLFGIGMQLGGGCGSGTLFTVGQGQVDMLITLAFFIIGATIGTAHLHWWLDFPNVGKISLITEMGWVPALALQLFILFVLYRFVRAMEFKRQHKIRSFQSRVQRENNLERFIHGPWPLWWGVIALAALSFTALLTAGYPWTITFAFGLWGTKIWTALGGDISSWAYWSAGYPAKALNQSVLADVTTVMDFGVIVGAMLAAALAGKYAPEDKITSKRVVTAIIGGLLLGYGARLAFGCNIGGMLAGIASGSLHGWLWLVAGFTGGIVGVKIRVWMKIDKPYGSVQ